MTYRKITVIFLLIFIFSASARADIKMALEISEYKSSLMKIVSEIEKGNLGKAKSLSRHLGNRDVRDNGFLVETDTYLLEAISESQNIRAAKKHLPKIEVLIKQLDNIKSAEQSDFVPDKMLLDNLRKAEDLDVISKDEFPAEVKKKNQEKKPVPPKEDFIDQNPAEEEADRQVSDLEEKEEPKFSTTKIVTIIAVSVIVAVLVILTVFTLRRGYLYDDLKKIKSQKRSVSHKEDDPLSRNISEWEKLALKYMRQGNSRSAIRAWYNAVLVSLYDYSILTFRKGSTNFEYVTSIPLNYAWRKTFVELTLKFDREWYGDNESSSGELSEFSHSAKQIISSVNSSGGKRK